MMIGPILIVDDEPSNLAVLKQILGADYRLVFARSGKEALSAVEKHQPALILLDIRMPDMDGYSVCRQLKADPRWSNTPVIFISALGEVGDETAGFESGGVDYITKPVSPAIVRARVRTHLSLVHVSILEKYIAQLEAQQIKIKRLSRIHAVLGGINSAIVRLRDRQALVAEACRVVVESGGFVTAWIGRLDEIQGSFVPTAWNSSEAGDLHVLVSTPTADDSQTQMLLNQILASGRTSLCNTSQTPGGVDGVAPSQNALSVVALPLTQADKTTGVLLIYASQMNCFDEEELKLLNELAADISFGLEHIEQEDQLRYLACYDALTGLANSLLFHDRLAQVISKADSQKDRVAVLVFDLDRFTNLNDTLGRHVGDNLLKHVADCMRQALPGSHNLARIGADTFAASVSGLDSASESAALQCTQLLQTLSRPFMVHDHEIRLGAHAGIALYPSDGNDAATLFKNAEAALKQAQDTGNAYLYYRPEINAQVAVHLTLERELRASVEAEQFTVYYQPKVDLRSGQIISAEALIRWQHPGRGLVPPTEFIPLAENSGLIIPMGEWILRAVCAQQLAWHQARYPIVPVAVNVSAIQFQQGQVYELVCQVLAELGLEAQYLELELTESALVENENQTIQTLKKLRDKGIHLALDDFGTGYSSLAYLKRFPFDILKIDRSFVTDITHNPDDAALAKTIIAIAHQLNMHPLAEGVETPGQLNYLREQGCEQMQGYYFSRPVPAGEFADMLCSGKCLSLPVAAPADEKTLLLVDDDPAVLAALFRTLRPDGYRILRAESGKEALNLLAVNAVQVIVSDQRMPEMSGSEFLGIVRQLYPNTLRIILSGYTDLKMVTDSVNEGAVFKLLSKPWDDELLRQQIREAFRLYRS